MVQFCDSSTSSLMKYLANSGAPRVCVGRWTGAAEYGVGVAELSGVNEEDAHLAPVRLPCLQQPSRGPGCASPPHSTPCWASPAPASSASSSIRRAQSSGCDGGSAARAAPVAGGAGPLTTAPDAAGGTSTRGPAAAARGGGAPPALSALPAGPHRGGSLGTAECAPLPRPSGPGGPHGPAQDKTTITKLLRISWEAVAKIVIDVVADQLTSARLHDLYRIGVDEVSYRKGHRYLTVVADHDRQGTVVWAGEGRGAATLNSFFDELGDQGCAALGAVSMDMGPAFKKSTAERAPQARQCVDPFHVVQLANQAIDRTRRDHWNAARRPRRGRGRPRPDAASAARIQSRWVKHTRWALVKDPDALSDDQLDVLHELRRERSPLYRCWQVKEGLRDLFRLRHPKQAPRHLAWWLAWASRSRIRAFVSLAATIRANLERILAAVEPGLSTPSSKGSTARSASSTTAATDTIRPLRSSP